MDEAVKTTTAGVLLVESDPADRENSAREIEQQQGLKLLGAFDRVAPTIAWLNHNRPDVLVTDLDLDDGSGLSIVRACDHRYPHCKILVRATQGMGDTVHLSIEAGAMGFLLKGAPDGGVSQGVLSMLDGGSPISAVVARMLFNRLRLPQADTHHISEPAPPPIEEQDGLKLTRREKQVLQLVARGDLYQEICVALHISLGTLQSHVKNIYRKLGAHSRSEAIRKSHERGLVRYR
jgi:DNA-binding NarL/FixJ family response regulator